MMFDTATILFALGWLMKALAMGVVAELATKPLSKKIARWIRHQVPVQHHLANHGGAYYHCADCTKTPLGSDAA